MLLKKKLLYLKDVKDELTQTRRNYIDFGIALDQYWNLSFLPEEINTNAFIKPVKTDGKTKLILSEQNINNYLRKYTNHKKKFAYDFYENKEVIKFKTKRFYLRRTKDI